MQQRQGSADHCKTILAGTDSFRHHDARKCEATNYASPSRTILKHPTSRVVLLTALGDEKNILEGLHIGADEYIVKPFSINILKASIANLLANRALLRKRYANLEINTEEEPSTTTTCSNSLDWKFMSNVKRHIEENMDNPDFTVDVLCSLLNMSRTSFYSKLKALTGQAPADFVRNIRLKHAAELLKEGKYSVTEVAERTGFCDGKYFREVFKKYFNVSPSQYAKGDTPRSPKGEGE